MALRILKEVPSETALSQEDVFSSALSWHREELAKLASALKGKRVVHVNATSEGGGVAEILRSFIPYLNAVGLEGKWYVLDPEKVPPGFFAFTNRLHNALQGYAETLSGEEWQVHEEVGRSIAEDLKEVPCDVLVVHDPQPLSVVRFLREELPAVLVMHLDTVNPQEDAWERVLSFVREYKRIVFSNRDFVNHAIPEDKLSIVPPAIDPLAPKQQIVERERARESLVPFGIPADGPLIVQVSRFDIWKNPSGVVEAFKLVKQNEPAAKLALVGFQQAKDNPEAQLVYERVRALAEGEEDALLFFDPAALGGAPVWEFTMLAQNAADVVVQNSVREGFGLTITEAMWKGKAVVGGPASGVKRQIVHKENGLIAESTEELAASIEWMLTDKEARERLGKAAKESVRKHFFMPRLLLDHLALYQGL